MTQTHADTCRSIQTIEPVSRLADVPLRRAICWHGWSWYITEDGQPAPPPDLRSWRPATPRGHGMRTCEQCGAAVDGSRRFCPTPARCRGAWAKANGHVRGKARK